MKSPRFDVKEETLAVLRPENYADPDTTDSRIFRSLQTYVGIIRKSA